MDTSPLCFFEFFAGGGMARLGLSERWRCLFANDFDPLKARTYRANFGADDLHVGDVWALEPQDLPGRADLAWASSPCQDVSLAGKREGLSGSRSSAFWGFWRLMQRLSGEGRAPRTLVIENVAGQLTSHAGQDFITLCAALAELDYSFGALEIDAAGFVAQSRPRLFVVATRGPVASTLERRQPEPPFHSVRVMAAHQRLPPELRSLWRWWRLAPPPQTATPDLAAVLEPDAAVRWRTPEQTQALLDKLSPAHRERLDEALWCGERRVGALFRRMRREQGRPVQRAELRFDRLAGCLRTPGGGSSRQFIVVAEDGVARVRHLSPREGARLMGLPDSYHLPPRPTAAFHVIGDGVAPPVVRHLAQGLLEPLLACGEGKLTPIAAE